MRKLKKKVQQENQELTEADRDFLENTLIPIAEKNRTELKKNQLKKWMPVLCCFLCCIVTIVICTTFLITKQNDYNESYSIRETELSEVNKYLQATQIIGEYDAIRETYQVRDEKAVNFIITKESEKTQKEVLSCDINVVIDREYRQGNPEHYDYHENYLDYTVYFSKMVKSDNFYIHNIRAYMDTGAEQYFIDYELWTTAANDNFSEFLKSTIMMRS